MRRKRKFKRDIKPDPMHNSVLLAQFINHLMKGGKKSIAQKIIYRTFDLIKEKTKKEPLDIFDLAVKNASPLVEVRSRRIGGARYQVPREVRGERKIALSFRWLIQAAAGGKGKSMSEKLAEEFILASKNEGTAVKKKEETHKIADANKAFAHFGW
ncbi:MAG: 30S ribosomal protein S7 [Candidatus Portnoybacteria bacterium CG_4_8_14_3_um_filter_44_15]|uniref:Small ribosomal subunit protein uS7 n=4 Tax=Candidatus Portnoyibacteriota TaxID=1817913 RepID=A0A2M7YLJ7_9BACT|nr:MAG: 30S ribosomal protein S7 [Parcubacteria group bacterium CG1_02_44_65]PIP15871.1 MAG: 30S ribosomal protein S7 [Candidatus Portnoybacteria bacterium CG23_combo_of_CG06-09_8_20_14_all_44_36]PIW74780.1 MAG: 30S ribosomal protein S7 [Candidatus Portnoybacteria bacterium CG_4_8_14_3_um_filter_44_15]PIZ69212.1 MAG: 30S ribosomal protein S7 [Candidatus Portnoybacteria bacterium CG_4_10_14_0_2_um_filter_43_36]PJA63840.1 MAG: 30S ribosomal protein S7 [Candidatus Portnoybacteria bacterium CG_4_9_